MTLAPLHATQHVESQFKACREAQPETIGPVGGMQGVSGVQSLSFQLLLAGIADLRKCMACAMLGGSTRLSRTATHLDETYLHRADISLQSRKFQHSHRASRIQGYGRGILGLWFATHNDRAIHESDMTDLFETPEEEKLRVRNCSALKHSICTQLPVTTSKS
jgi:hypothetical protein